MKTSQVALNKAIKALIDDPALIPPGWDGPEITHDYLNRLTQVLHELIDLSVQGDHKGRHYVKYALRSIYTHENGIDLPIEKLGDDATPEQHERNLELALVNVEIATKVAQQLARDFRYRREVEESKSA